MTKNQVSFFATKKDIILLMNDIQEKGDDFCYSFIDKKKKSVSIYNSIDEIPTFSVALSGNQNNEKTFLLIEKGITPLTREVKQRNGGCKLLYDQMSHPSSVVIRPGGLFEQESCIIVGKLGTISSDKWSISKYKFILTNMKKHFTKVKSFYVGKEAAQKLDEGWRLTSNVKSPVEYDLQREE